MNTVETNILNAVEQTAPEVPAVELAVAALHTATDPSAGNILADVELGVKLIKQLKAKLAGAHPKALDIIKSLF